MRNALLIALFALALFPASAAAKKEPALWATVNVCDTRQAARRDRHPRVDAGHAEGGAADRCASASSTSTPKTIAGSTSRTPTPAGAPSAARRASRPSPAGASTFARPSEDGHAARRRALPLASRRHAATPGRAGHRTRPPLQRGCRSDRLLRRHLRTGQLSKQPRVVGDDPGHAEPLEPPNARRAHRPRSTRRARRRPRAPRARAAARRAANAPSARRSGRRPCAP